VDTPFSPDGAKLPDAVDPQNVQWAIGQCLQTLQSPRAPDVEKARMLRFLIHFVGDVHQPLHCVSRFTAEHPTGDQGGNLFPLAGATRNLHAYWDSGAGLFTDVHRPLSSDGQAAITKLAAECVAANPQESAQGIADLTIADWVKEGVALAKDKVYNTEPGKEPGADYANMTRDLSRQRVALAGYRLAALLNRVYGGAPAPPTSQ